jgi:hypothetical protein
LVAVVPEGEKAMTIKDDTDAERLLASLPESTLDRLVDMIASRLGAKKPEVEPSRQVVAGSSPVSRSILFRSQNRSYRYHALFLDSL